MKHNIVAIIVHLLEVVMQYTHSGDSPVGDQKAIRNSLEKAGFSRKTIIDAFDWLRELIEQQAWYATYQNENHFTDDHRTTFRIFSGEELVCLDTDVRSFLMALEQSRVLDTKMREVVINQLMQLSDQVVTLEEAKWVVFLVLMSKFNANLNDIRSYFMNTILLDE